MKRRTQLHHLPARLATGIFMVNAGAGKLRADGATAEAVHAMASRSYPAFASLDATVFTRVLGAAELGLGLALAVPTVPTTTAAAGLSAFSAGLLGVYLRTPGMREPGSLRPTREGTAVAKDVWLLGIAATLLADQAATRLRERRDRRRSPSHAGTARDASPSGARSPRMPVCGARRLRGTPSGDAHRPTA